MDVYAYLRHRASADEPFAPVRRLAGTPAFAAPIIVAVVAAVLCWQTNAQAPMHVRVAYVVLAVVFSGMYMAYYFVYHFLGGM